MPNTREKLIELLDKVGDCNAKYCSDCEFSQEIEGCVRRQKEIIADCLIANGVTAREQVRDRYWATEYAYKNGYKKGYADALMWISVKERLPEPFVSVLACIPSEAPLPIVHESYIADHDGWVCILTAERYKPGEVTHWMPLPEPPKGE